jgi:hypothetical protein
MNRTNPRLLIGDHDYSSDIDIKQKLIDSGNEDLVLLLDVRQHQCRFDVDLADNGRRYFSIRAFCTLNEIKIGRYESQTIRGLATKQSKADDVWIICEENFANSKIYLYAESILRLAFKELHDRKK